MQLNRETLVTALTRAFDCGQGSSYELRDQCIEEILWVLQQGKDNPWVKMSVKDLCTLPSGRKIFHSLLGEGVMTIKNGERYVQFAGFRMELAEEGWPWTENLQINS